MTTDPHESKTLEVDHGNGRVIIKQRRQNGDLVYTLHDAQAALEVAEAIAKASFLVKYGKPRPGVLVSLADQVVERKRLKLYNRYVRMLTSMMAENRAPEVQATQLVDAALRELT